MNALTEDPQICKEIVHHISIQNDRQDSLDGIILGVFDKKFRGLTDKITKNLSMLISMGVVLEALDKRSKKIFKLSIEPADLPKYLKKLISEQ